MDARELLTGPISRKLGRPVEIGPTKLDPSSFAPYRELRVEDVVIRFPAEDVQDMLSFGYTEELMLDWLVNVAREQLGEKVPPRPWIVQPLSYAKEKLLQHLDVRLEEVKFDPEYKALSRAALEYFCDNLLPDLPVTTIVAQAPAWVLFVDDGTAIYRRNTMMMMETFEPEKDLTTPKALARGLYEYLMAQFKPGLDQGLRMYFSPFIMPFPLRKKGDRPGSWYLRYAIYGHEETT